MRVVRGGCCLWSFRHWQTVYYYFRLWRDCEWFIALNDKLRREVRLKAGREAEPSAAIIDSQSAKTDEQAEANGFDAGKKVKGGKRHILVDTLGLLLMAAVLTADIQDRDGAKILFGRIKNRMPRLFLIWADGGYRGKLIEWVAKNCLWVLEIIKRSDDVKGFIILPRRWVVERTFSWLNRNRRLSKEYERKVESSEAWIYFSMSILMVKRLRT